MFNQALGYDLETGCPKLTIVKSVGILFFKGDHNILGSNHKHVFTNYLDIISLYNVIGIILRWKNFLLGLKLTF